MNNNILLVLSAGAIALLFSVWKTRWIHSQEEGTPKMTILGNNIAEGAMAKQSTEFLVFCNIGCYVTWNCNHNSTDLGIYSAFIFSRCIGIWVSRLLGMKVATNNRTTNAARQNLESALKIAFSGGSVWG